MNRYTDIRSFIDAGNDYLMPLSNLPLLKMDDEWISLGEEGAIKELELIASQII